MSLFLCCCFFLLNLGFCGNSQANILMCGDRGSELESSNNIRSRSSVKVGDFGMSTFVGLDGLVRGRCGTPGYVAPVSMGNPSTHSASLVLYKELLSDDMMYFPFLGDFHGRRSRRIWQQGRCLFSRSYSLHYALWVRTFLWRI